MGSNNVGERYKKEYELFKLWMAETKQVRQRKYEEDERNGKEKLYPRTKQEFADYHGMSRVTLWRWENDPETQKEVLADKLTMVSADDISQILDVMKQKAMEGNVQAARFLMTYMGLDKGMPTEAPKETDPEKMFAGKSDEEIEAMLREMDD